MRANDNLALIDVSEVRELELIHVRACEIVLDEKRNTRSYASKLGSGFETAGIAKDSADFTDEQLREDIRKRGMLQPIGVRQIGDVFHCDYGNRRLRAARQIHDDYPVPCILRESHEDEERDNFEALSANLCENMNRRRLKPFELAEALHRMQQLRPELDHGQLASSISISRTYASNLILIRSRAVPKLWQLFVSYGLRLSASVGYMELLPIVRLPKTEQLDAWRKLLDAKEAHQKKKKTNGRRRPAVATMRKWLAELDDADVAQLFGSDQFVAGVRYALLAVLGEERWRGKTPHLTPRRNRVTNPEEMHKAAAGE